MDCRHFEERLAEAMKVIGLVDGLVRSRRENVFRGQEAANAELDAAEKNLFADLLPLMEETLRHLADFERTFGHVEAAAVFRDCHERVRTFLANWAPAAPSRAIGSRMMDFSEQDADEIHSLLEAPAGSPGRIKGEPRSVPPATRLGCADQLPKARGRTMSSNLTRIPFAVDLLPMVESFGCGDEPWQREVSDWIKAPPGAGGAVEELEHGAQVWLYATEEGEVVGFGSLAAASQRWPRSKDPPIPASVIPMLGVDQRLWGQPPGPADGHNGI